MSACDGRVSFSSLPLSSASSSQEVAIRRPDRVCLSPEERLRSLEERVSALEMMLMQHSSVVGRTVRVADEADWLAAELPGAVPVEITATEKKSDHRVWEYSGKYWRLRLRCSRPGCRVFFVSNFGRGNEPEVQASSAGWKRDPTWNAPSCPSPKHI